MPASLPEILQDLDALLNPGAFEDYCPNGLQVPGATVVSKVATGVSAHLQLFERAREEQAELILTHHGLFWGSGPAAPIDTQMKRRLKLLFDADMSLASYHLPLDAHPEIGNNALLASALGAESTTPFAFHKGRAIGTLARFAGEGLPMEELLRRVKRVTERNPLAFENGLARIETLGIVTGAGADYLAEAASAGAQAFLTGEPAERVMAQARELQMSFIAAGHYATETLGIRRLGEHVAERFGVRHVYVDVPNPV